MSENGIKVSVIIPVYNAEKFLSQCLDSAVNQTLENIEIICIDDGSTDNSQKIIHEYMLNDHRVKEYHQENSGAGTARNTGLSVAQGAYILFLDSDDYIDPNLCSKTYAKAVNTNADIVLFDANFFSDENSVRTFRNVQWILRKDFLPQREVFSARDIADTVFQSVAGGPCNKLYRREFLQEKGIYFPEMKSLEDVPFVYLSLAEAERITYLTDILAHYRRTNQNQNLVSKIDKYPTRIFAAYRELKVRLDSRNIYELFKASFLARAASDFVDQYLYVIKNPYSKEYYMMYLARKASYEFDLRGKSIEHISKKLQKELHELYKKEDKKFEVSDESSIHSPEVSIIVPVYNNEKYLRQCLNSIISQTYKNYELILVDDGSTDESLNILKEYAELDKRIIVLEQENRFAGAARNYGMTYARGRYLLFLDSDDFFDERLVEQLYKTSTCNDTDITICNGFYYNNETKEYTEPRILVQKNNLPSTDVFSYRDIPEKILHITIDCPWNKMFKKSFIDFHELKFQEIRSANDVFFVDSAILLAERISVLDERLIYYRTNVSTSLQANRSKEPLNFYTALTSVKRRISTEAHYQYIAKSLLSLFVAGCRSHLNRAKDRVEFDLLYDFYNNEGFAEWEIDCPKREQFIYVDDFKWVKEIITSTDDEYWSRLHKSNSSIKSENKYRPDIIVSLTTYPARIKTVHIPIKNILTQTIRVDKIILWLAIDQFPNKEKDLPIELNKLCSDQVEIRWCKDDIKSHKKYYYVMQEYPDSIIITIDDDLYYSRYMIEKLLDSYKKHPKAVSAMRTHLIVKDEMARYGIAAYKQWPQEYSVYVDKPMMELFSTSGAGTLFPPKCMSTELFNLDVIKECCPWADDIWLKFCQIMAGVPVVLVDGRQGLKYIDGTQEDALWKNNVTKGRNDEQLIHILDRYISSEGEKELFLEKLFSSPNNTACSKPCVVKTVYVKDDEASLIRASASYRIGRFITFIPRKIRGGIRCYKEHGMRYTMRRIKEKFRNLFRKKAYVK